MDVPSEVLVEVVMSVFWLIWGAALVRIIFIDRHYVAGWTLDEAMVIYGVFYALFGWFFFALRSSIVQLPAILQRDEFDQYLLKPVGALVYLIVHGLEVVRVVDIALGLGVVAYCWLRIGAPSPWYSLVMFVVSFCLSIIVLTAVVVLFALIGFWARKADQLMPLAIGFMQAGRYPSDVYGGPPHLLVGAFLASASLSSIPARMIVGRGSWLLIGEYAAIVATIVAGVVILWRLGIARYCSGR